jgi:nucleoside-diphosphate-sugar epimerase
VRGDAQFQYLVAHVVFVPAQNLSDAELQLLVGNLPLPQYMWPAMIIPVDRLPTNSNGKIDREAIGLLPLPTKRHESHQAQRSLTLSEGELGLLWESVLQEAASSLRIRPDSDFFMLGGNSNLLVRLQGVIRDAMGIAMPITEMYQASTLSSMAAHISAKKEQLRCHEAIVWDIETAVPDSMLISSVLRTQEHKRQIKDQEHHNHHRHHREILLTGSTTFLGSAILKSLLQDVRVRRIHCIAVPVENQNGLPRSDRIVIYTGSLRNAGLGLSQTEYIKLQSCADLIIHAGALGHCLNNYSSLRVPNFHSTRFLATLALLRHIPVHFISSNRVTLLAGDCTALPPVSLSSYLPATDGSEGFTAAKWASERFLENVARETGLDVCVHRACAVVGDGAPNDDALNALLRYSMLMRAVPHFHNFDGFLDFRDVHDVANEIALEALATPYTHEIPVHAARGALQPAQNIPSLRFRHHSSGVRVPVLQFRQHMELIHGCRFHELSVAAWIERARELGIEVLITRYLEALVERGERILFPYLGEVEE